MNTTLTTIELQNLKIALGLNNKNKTITQNMFFSQKPCALWEDLINKGFATVKSFSKDGIIYCVTEIGINICLKNL